MKQTLLFSTFFISSFSFAQNYAVDQIPADLIKDAYAVVRKNEEKIELLKVDELKYTEDVVVTVLSKAGDNYVGAQANYDANTKIDLFEATLYDANGKEIKKFKTKDFGDQSYVTGGQMYTDDRIKYLNYTPTNYPYTIHYKIITTNKNTLWIPRWSPIRAANLSIEKSSYQFVNKTSSTIRLKEDNFKGFDIAKTGDNNNLSYSLNNVLAFNEEDQMVGSQKIFPRAILASNQINIDGVKGNFDNWNDYGKWTFDNLIRSKLDFTPSQKSTFQNMVKDAKSDEEKVQILYKYLQNKVRYIGVQLGIGGLSPFPNSYVESKSYGDCKALSNYMIGMLDAVNIKSYHTILFAGNPIDIDEQMMYQQGNHMIVYIPLNGKDIWLEATSQTAPYNYLGDFAGNRKVLIVDEKGGKIIPSQQFKTEDNQLFVNGNATLLADGTLNFDFSETSKGLIYENFARFNQLSEKDLDVRLKNRFSYLQGISFKKKEFNNDWKNAVFTSNFEFSAPNYAKIQGNNIILNIIPVNKEETSVKKMKDRKFDFNIETGYVDEVFYTLTLPSGYKLPQKFDAITVKSAFGEYQLEINPKENNTFEIKRIYKQFSGTFSKEKYNEYVEFRRQISGYDNTKLILEKL
ncbi:DUF3857 domain-containing protein [Empedobacter sp. GD03861]|uniref:DUF3857 domain-containing protein n=1 Tax=Empedobacter sp. GD03861 TaxID=2975390 RepID=UPI0024492B0D|nr:DUF3857 domain-containing protein [Empedobacter sp. GD03861]MDH0673055.1 DUF3857 domain-containing protein [Empedobacter sp. GD03861]